MQLGQDRAGQGRTTIRISSLLYTAFALYHLRWKQYSTRVLRTQCCTEVLRLRDSVEFCRRRQGGSIHGHVLKEAFFLKKGKS
jgi:hypothetical protein